MKNFTLYFWNGVSKLLDRYEFYGYYEVLKSGEIIFTLSDGSVLSDILVVADKVPQFGYNCLMERFLVVDRTILAKYKSFLTKHKLLMLKIDVMEKLNEIRYKHINTREKYDMLLKTGFFFEFHPELTGDWEVDCPIITNGWDDARPINSDPVADSIEDLCSASDIKKITDSFYEKSEIIIDSYRKDISLLIRENANLGKFELILDYIIPLKVKILLQGLGYKVDDINGETRILWY